MKSNKSGKTWGIKHPKSGIQAHQVGKPAQKNGEIWGV